MDGIKIEVTGNIARVTEKPKRITSGTVGLPVEFTFDEQWDGLDKTAVFQAGHVCKIVSGLGTSTTVPWEVLQNAHEWLTVGVYGENADGSTAIPTIWTNVKVIDVGTSPSGDNCQAPSKAEWTRMLIGQSAYELAVQHGFEGTEEQWIESLNGTSVELRCVDNMIQWRRVVEPEEPWHDLANVAEFQAEAVAAANRAETAKEDAVIATSIAEEAMRKAASSENNSGSNAEAADLARWKAETHAKNAELYAENADAAAKRAEQATVSPTVEVAETDGGHRVTITDYNGEKSFDVMDGASGVYLGSGEMPDDCNVQIDPDGEPIDLQQEIKNAISAQEKHYELIETITLGEEVSNITRTQEPDGTPYNLAGCILRATIPPADNKSGNAVVHYTLNPGKSLTSYMLTPVSATGTLRGFSRAWTDYDRWMTGWWTCRSGAGEFATYYENPYYQGMYGANDGYLSKVEILCSAKFPVGTVIEIWGVRV